MSHRFLASLGAVTALLAAPLPGQSPKPAAAAKSKSWTTPRTPDGHPDLQGTWTNATLTRMERPPEFNGKATLTDKEAATFEQTDLDKGKDPKNGEPLILGGQVFSGANDGYNALFIDRGSELARVDGVKRTSLIVDPPDGKVPRIANAARGRGGRGGPAREGAQARPLAERCLIGFGSTSGPPMMPVLYNNNYQIVQTPDNIMILVEMVHDVRTIRMNGTHVASSIRPWLGDSIGHWEGDTLVVDTTNFHEGNRFAGGSENLHIVERFTRADANTILYKVTLDDPAAFAKPWTMEYPFRATTEPLFEYACHEGNYALPAILGGQRLEAEAAAKK